LIDPNTRQVFTFHFKDLKQSSVVTVLNSPAGLIKEYRSGKKDDHRHHILGFPHPEIANEWIVLDLTCLQYGAKTKGIEGETYFLGTLSDWKKMMLNCCTEVVPIVDHPFTGAETGKEHEWLANVAAKVLERWLNRSASDPTWCDYCGRDPRSLSKFCDCGGCDNERVRYCSQEHQQKGWGTHKYVWENPTKGAKSWMNRDTKVL
jgi:hypothetical protein